MKGTIATAEILSVGTELLIGDIVNTDAAFVSRGLASLGISQYYQTVVGDNRERLDAAIRLASSRSQLLIVTGGLGPTYDDITKETAAAVFGRELILDEESLSRIRSFFDRRGKIMTDNNIKQAMMPVGATVFPNPNGTADGCAVETPDGSRMLILLPGPPRELEPMFRDQVMPFLAQYTDRVLVSKNVNICGMGESEVESILRDRMMAALNPTEAPYCLEGEVRIRVTAAAPTVDEAIRLCDRDIEELYQTRVGPYIYGVDSELKEAVVKQLTARGLTLFAAESCTGGLFAKEMTDVSGASQVFRGGVVSYVNAIKCGLLGVSAATIAQYTEVSEACAAEMAEGAARIGQADIGVATTGYASGGAGVPEGMTGVVFIAVSDRNGTTVKRLALTGNRDHVRKLAVKQLLAMLLARMKEE
ncbi:MAG: competence/damage-inducible protein A [Ruminococcaceae bacterium]|nr:competence/damage-inducible protein A [Oscillospiraceae bacterium]